MFDNFVKKYFVNIIMLNLSSNLKNPFAHVTHLIMIIYRTLHFRLYVIGF